MMSSFSVSLDKIGLCDMSEVWSPALLQRAKAEETYCNRRAHTNQVKLSWEQMMPQFVCITRSSFC